VHEHLEALPRLDETPSSSRVAVRQEAVCDHPVPSVPWMDRRIRPVGANGSPSAGACSPRVVVGRTRGRTPRVEATGRPGSAWRRCPRVRPFGRTRWLRVRRRGSGRGISSVSLPIRRPRALEAGGESSAAGRRLVVEALACPVGRLAVRPNPPGVGWGRRTRRCGH
jgi:hypothetical protein